LHGPYGETKVYNLAGKCNAGTHESSASFGSVLEVFRGPTIIRTPNVMIDDAIAASEIAEGAGHLLLSVRATGGDPEALKASGDATSQRYISEQLSKRYPIDAILSEEADDDSDRLVNRRVWIIDPLDGTREFSEPPRIDWAVHVALVENGELVAGAVALPGEGLIFSSCSPFPSFGPVPSRPRILVSRTRPTEHAVSLAEVLNGELIPMGSAGAKAMAVVRGDAEIYVHSGGQWEWDSAAPVAVASAAGLHVSRLDGSPVRYNQPNPWLPDILICRSELSERVIELCRVPA
jgi:3'(2'), 5'-bisphosphate nucleotidase